MSVNTTDEVSEAIKGDFRMEKDSLGDVQVPADAWYGAQTVRAIRNFPITGLKPHSYSGKGDRTGQEGGC